MSTSRYPVVIFFRHDKYSEIDNFIENNKESLMCSIHITNDISELNKLYNHNYHILVTYGDTYAEYDYISSNIPSRFSSRWFHKNDISNIEGFNHNVNYCYITNVIDSREKTRPIFSIFTTCFKSYNYINTAYESIKKQTLKDWEWVIMDDTPEDEHFTFLRDTLSHDNRIRLYKRDKNSGNIGNVKNEAISLCRGKYVLEMDHDDEILKDCLLDSYNIFQSDPEIGFVYGDTINLFRDGQNCTYPGNFLCKGYGSYYSELIDNQWRFIYNTPNINNVTLSHLTCLPNHPRIWNRAVLMELESYSEYLPICDDYEILLRTCCSKYKVAKNNKAQYIQYMNNEGNNFSMIRNSEINRIGPKYISPMFYAKYGVQDKMKELDAYEDPRYVTNHSDIWKRGPEYQHKIMNSRINLDYNKQYCIINDAIDNVRLKELYQNSKNDFLVLSNKTTTSELWVKLNSLGFGRMKCYGYKDCTDEELIKYFKMMYKNDNCDYEIIQNIREDHNNRDIMNLSVLNVNYFKESFANASPFKHIILDNVINEKLLNNALNEINNIPERELLSDYVLGIENVQINKFCYRDFNKLKYITCIKDYFESDTFINWLEQVTGIDNLQKDITHNGGGIHIIKQNGKLAIHSDFNRHRTTMKYRRLNLLLYLNKDYQEDYNGHLELWNKQMTSCEQKISPLFNRIVLFKVDDDANHGHPEIWNSENSNRTSLALYYYTDDRPEHEKSENYNAVWKCIQKPKCYIIHNNTVGGAYKFLTDTMKMYPNYEYIFIDSKHQLMSIRFNKSDLFILQNVLYTDIEITDIINVYNKYQFKLIIQIHDFQWLCQDQHQYTYDIPSAYLSNNINVSTEITELLLLADKVVMNSQFTHDVYSKHFDSTNFTVCYPSDYNIQVGIKNIPEIQNKCMNIGVFSPLCKFKGERYVNYLKSKYECDTIQFQIVGQNIPYYNENEFYDFIRKYNINGFLLLNEWGETYGYLLTKIINSGLPLLYNNFGAVKERLSGTQEKMEHYFKVYDNEHNDDVTIDYTILETQFNQFVKYINTNAGTVGVMNEELTIRSRPVYDELFLPITNVYQNREIPKHVFQTSKDILPPYVKELINIHCPDWKYSHFTDKECIQFFIDNPIAEFPNIIQKFNSFTQGQHKADIFRYYYLYLRGGVFLDSDAMFETNIDNIIQNYDSVFAKSHMKNEHLFNGFIATYPRNEIIYDALKHAYYTENHILQTNYHYLCEELLRIANTEQKKASRQNMVIYQEYADTVDGKGVGRFKNTNEDTVFIHYWQDREIPSKLVNSLTPTYLEKQNKKIGIFNSFPFHYEVFGFILNYAKNNNYEVDIFTNTQNNLGWIDFYKDNFNNFNIIDFNHFNGNTIIYDKVFVITDYDNAFKTEWMNKNVICINHTSKIKRPEYKHYLNVAQFKDSTFDYINPCYNLNIFQNKIQNNTVNIIGGGYGLNFSIVNRLHSNNKIKLNIFVRNTNEINIENMSILDKNKFDIHFKIAIDTTEMINELNKSSYILINYNSNQELNTGRSCSGSLQLALSTLCKPIMAKTANKYLQIENALEFDIDSDEPINIDDEIDFKAIEQERNKYVDKFEKYLNNIKQSYNFEHDKVNNDVSKENLCLLMYGELRTFKNNFRNNLLEFLPILQNYKKTYIFILLNHKKEVLDKHYKYIENICKEFNIEIGFIETLETSNFNLQDEIDYCNKLLLQKKNDNKQFYNNFVLNLLYRKYKLIELVEEYCFVNKLDISDILYARLFDFIIKQNIPNDDIYVNIKNTNFENNIYFAPDTTFIGNYNLIKKSMKIDKLYNCDELWNNKGFLNFSYKFDSILTNNKDTYAPEIQYTANIYFQSINAYNLRYYRWDPNCLDKNLMYEIFVDPNRYTIDLDSINIPKKLFQTWETTNIEPEFQKIIDKWKEFNPDYEYIFHDSEQRLKFIEENFEENVVNAYNKIIPGAYKCDLWRYCVLYIYGGFYADIDTLCMGKLNDLTGDNIDFIVPIDLNLNPREGEHNLACGFIGSVPKSPILLDAINRIVFNVENNIIPTSKLDFSGPGVLGRAVNKFLKLEETSSFTGKEGIKNSINFLHFDSNTEYVSDINTNKIILQNKNKNSDIIRLYNNECNKINGFKSWNWTSVSPI